MAKPIEDNDNAAEFLGHLSDASALSEATKAAFRGVIGADPLYRDEIPYNRANAPVVITGVLTSDGSTPVVLPVDPIPQTGDITWAGEGWALQDDGEGNWTLLDTSTGALWYGLGADIEDAVWTPGSTETGSPLVTPQLTGAPGQGCIVDDGTNPPRVFVNAAIVAGDPDWVEVITKNYLKNQTIATVSAAAVLDGGISANGTLALEENTTLSLINVTPNQTGVIRITNDNGWELSLDDGVLADASAALIDIALCDPEDLWLLTYYAGTTRAADIWHLQKVTGGNV